MAKAKNISKETLINLYIVERKTIYEVAETLQVNFLTVRKYMKKHGIESRDVNKEKSLVNRLGMTHAQFKNKLEELYLEQEMSINKIAQKYDVASTVIRRRMKEYQIPLRNNKEAKSLNSGSKHPDWRGGTTTHSDGYKLIRVAGHPYPDPRGYVYEHRHVMEIYLGRYLKTDEHVHHINGNKLDNKVENLEILTSSEHAYLHHPGKSGIKYVRWHKPSNKWVAVVPCNGKQKHLGFFTDKEEAKKHVEKFMESHP